MRLALKGFERNFSIKLMLSKFIIGLKRLSCLVNPHSLGDNQKE